MRAYSFIAFCDQCCAVLEALNRGSHTPNKSTHTQHSFSLRRCMKRHLTSHARTIIYMPLYHVCTLVTIHKHPLTITERRSGRREATDEQTPDTHACIQTCTRTHSRFNNGLPGLALGFCQACRLLCDSSFQAHPACTQNPGHGRGMPVHGLYTRVTAESRGSSSVQSAERKWDIRVVEATLHWGESPTGILLSGICPFTHTGVLVAIEAFIYNEILGEICSTGLHTRMVLQDKNKNYF